MSSVKTMLLRFEKNVTWKTPILFNSFFYSQVVTHWKLRTLLQNILWTFRYLLISCYFIFSATKLFIYLNYVNFSDKQLSREDKKTFYLLKTRLVQVKRYKEQLSQLGELSKKLKKLTKTVSFTLRKALLNKTSSLLSKLLISKNVILSFNLVKQMFPSIVFLVRVGRAGKKYLRKGPQNVRFFKKTLWDSMEFNTILPSFYWNLMKLRFIGKLVYSKKNKTRKSKIEKLRNRHAKLHLGIQSRKLQLLRTKFVTNIILLKDNSFQQAVIKKKRSIAGIFVRKQISPRFTALVKVLLSMLPSIQKEYKTYNLFLRLKFNAWTVKDSKIITDLRKAAVKYNLVDRICAYKDTYFWLKHKRYNIANWLSGETRGDDYFHKVRHVVNPYQLIHSKSVKKSTIKSQRKRSLFLSKERQKQTNFAPSSTQSRRFCTQLNVTEEESLTDYLENIDKNWASGEAFKVPKGMEYIYELQSKRIFAFSKTYKDFDRTKVLPQKNKYIKKNKINKYTIWRIKTAFLNKIVSIIIKKTCLMHTAVVSQNILYSKIGHLLSIYNQQILQSLPQQYSSYFYYKDLTNILVCALTLRCSSLLSFYLARLYEHVPKHSLIFHVFNRIFAVFKFYCKAPLSLRVLVKGRVNRRLRKHTVCLIQTQVSTSAVRSAIDYSLAHSFTGASVLGIKVWVISFSKSVAVKTFAQRYRVY